MEGEKEWKSRKGRGGKGVIRFDTVHLFVCASVYNGSPCKKEALVCGRIILGRGAERWTAQK